VRTTFTLLLCTLAVGGLTACGGDSDGGSAGLGDALDTVSAGRSSQLSFAYSDVAALREATELPAPDKQVEDVKELRRWSVPATMGAPALTQQLVITRGDRKGIDLYSADRFITIGVGDLATRIDGFEDDPEALARFGDASSAKDGTVVVASDPEGRDELLGQGDEKLGDRAEYAAAAACLGDVVSATILSARAAGAPEDAAQIVGIGVRGGDEPTDVLCVVGDEGQAKRAADGLGKVQDLDDAKVDTGDTDGRSWARAVVTPAADEPLGSFYLGALQQMRLRDWLSGG
jgi:hypothetical protein